MSKKRIPVAVCAIVNDVLRGSHNSLDALFERAGAPGPPPDLSHASKWKTWLLKANDDPDTDAYSVLGRVIEELMELEPTTEEEWYNWRDRKQRVEDALRTYGLKYVRGGRIIAEKLSPSTTSLTQLLKAGDFDHIEVEINRALETIDNDPAIAVTAACSLLETLFTAYLEENGIELPSKRSIKPLWSAAQKSLGLDPKDQEDQDVQRILSGMISVVDGVGALRTHAGSAHGRGKLRYRVSGRHARLVVNSAHTLALFVIETWEERKRKKSTGSAA